MQKTVKCCAILASAIAMVVSLAPPASASAATVVDPGQKLAGKTYAQWSAAWWQWAAGITTSQSTLDDSTGAHCGVNQQGPVWFLAGTTGGSALTSRTCTLPSGKGVLIPIINGECSTVEGNGTTDAELRACAKDLMDHVTSATMSVDSVPVDLGRPLATSRFRVQSPLFNITFVPNDQFGVPDGSGQAVADGFWVLLAPPSAGHHTVDFRGEAHFPKFTFVVNVHYDLTIS
jgi:hypothetical protein